MVSPWFYVKLKYIVKLLNEMITDPKNQNEIINQIFIISIVNIKIKWTYNNYVYNNIEKK